MRKNEKIGFSNMFEIRICVSIINADIISIYLLLHSSPIANRFRDLLRFVISGHYCIIYICNFLFL